MSKRRKRANSKCKWRSPPCSNPSVGGKLCGYHKRLLEKMMRSREDGSNNVSAFGSGYSKYD